MICISLSLLYFNNCHFVLPRNFRIDQIDTWYQNIHDNSLFSERNIWAITYPPEGPRRGWSDFIALGDSWIDVNEWWRPYVTHIQVTDADQCSCPSPSFALSLSSLMHRTRTAESQVIAERPFVFVCTPDLDQEYVQTSCSIEITGRELSPLMCKSQEAKLPVKHVPSWLYQWFWIWNAWRRNIPFVTGAFGHKSIWVLT